MKVDIIPAKTNGDFKVWDRECAPDSQYDDAYEGKPLFGPASDCDCIEWCEDNGHRYRHRKFAALVAPSNFSDLEKRCDKVYAKLSEGAAKCGRRLVSDCTYRASAAWKESPTHYCYSGDFGGQARLVKTGETKPDPDALDNANHNLTWLFGVSDSLWELGFILTFDRDGKHKIFSTFPEWVTVEEEA